MSLKAQKMSRFCRLAELTYLETGKLGEQGGHWFRNFKGKRLFFTDDDIHSRLERRKLTLFAANTVSTATAPMAPVQANAQADLQPETEAVASMVVPPAKAT